MQATLTEKSRTKLQHNGHSYIFHKLSADGEVRFWSCERHHAKGIRCKGRLHTNLNNNVLREVGNHQCEPSAARMEAQRVITKIKCRAEQTMEPPATIRSLALQNVATPVLAQLPTKNAIKKVIKRVRHEINAPPPIPNTLTDLIIPDAYKTYGRTEEQTEQFLLSDSGVYQENGREQRILIFGRESNAEAANRRLQCAFACSHPSIWNFIDLLRKDQKLSDDDFAKCSTGQEPPQKAKKYREADRRILTMVQNYLPLNNADTNIFPIHHPFNHHFIITFLIGISRNYEMRP